MLEGWTQKITTFDIDANTLQNLQDYLDLGYKIYSITNLNPTFDKILVIYYEPIIVP